MVGGRLVLAMIFNDAAKQFIIVLLYVLFGVTVLFVIAGWFYANIVLIVLGPIIALIDLLVLKAIKRST